MTVYASDGTPYYSEADKEAAESYKRMIQINRLHQPKRTWCQPDGFTAPPMPVKPRSTVDDNSTDG